MVTKTRNGLYTRHLTDEKPSKRRHTEAEIKEWSLCSWAHMGYIEDGDKVIAFATCPQPVRCRGYSICRQNHKLLERNTY